MKLHEYKAKEIFAEQGIPVPSGILVKGPEQLKELQHPVALKSQVLVGGRGKAGGIKFADNIDDAKSVLEELFKLKIKGLAVKQVLVEEKLDLEGAQELYLGFVEDRAAKTITAMMSAAGGIDIEQVASEMPEKIIKKQLQPGLKTLNPYEAREMAIQIGLKGATMTKVADIMCKLFNAMIVHDAVLAEINPLVITKDGMIIATDAKMNIDDNALFRQKNLLKDVDISEEYTPIEQKARKYGLAYVELEGDIAVIGCGAGLVMASLDTIKLYGGEPANFLDVGGGATAENMKQALEVVAMKDNLKSIFINIFGGITRCDEIANGIVEFEPKIPIALRMMGTNEDEGKKILKEHGYNVFDSMEDCAEYAVKLASGEEGR
ncbi:MAG: ADP-forming succinate--CoA ligase subunit beta [Thermoplasmata archaeon]|nr:MAG: ADP-forming succinate--CoA ligase subunit beta [Thermoplasmata archaeon]